MIRDYISLFWRRKIWVVIPLVCGVLIANVLIAYLPKRYRSTTLILVEAQKIPEEYVQSPLSGTVEGRLSTIQQQILSRSLLQKLVDNLNLQYESSKKTSSEEMIDQIRKNLDLETIGPRTAVQGFSLSFQAEDPVVAMKVTNELASLFIEENLKIREQMVEGTSEFLNSELTNLKETLERQENQIGEFKRLHMGELPEQLEANLRALDRFQSDLLSTQLAKKSAQERRIMLEKTVEMVRQRSQESPPMQAGRPLAPPEPASPLVLELMQRKRDLAALRMEYKESYPDIALLKRQIAELEDQVGMLSLNEAPPSPGPSQPGELSRENEGERAYVADLQRQIQGAKLEGKNLEERERELQHQIKIYERRVEQVPAREQELATLLRDYENTKINYGALLDKKLNAKIAENLEKRQKGEQFRIIDPANLPQKPFTPNPLMINLAGVGLGLGVGVGLVLMREQLDRSLRKSEDLEQATSIPVLASIPDFTDEMKKVPGTVKTTRVSDEKVGEGTHGA